MKKLTHDFKFEGVARLDAEDAGGGRCGRADGVDVGLEDDREVLAPIRVVPVPNGDREPPFVGGPDDYLFLSACWETHL